MLNGSRLLERPLEGEGCFAEKHGTSLGTEEVYMVPFEAYPGKLVMSRKLQGWRVPLEKSAQVGL